MRHHAQALREQYALEYRKLTAETFSESYEEKLTALLQSHPDIEEVVCYTVEDAFFRQRLARFCAQQGLILSTLDSPKFLFPLSDFEDYREEGGKPKMQHYYKRQRLKLKVLLNSAGAPLQGKWSLDTENRKKLPTGIDIPAQPQSQWSAIDREVMKLVGTLFPDHPGSLEGFNWATTRREALARLRDFLENRLANFGPYEDALESQETFIFHSALSPYLNMGLLTPAEVLDRTLEHFEEYETHYPSVEGFVRQIMGWREFLRGMYHSYDMEGNYFGHQRRFRKCWYTGETGIPPLDDSIERAQEYGYTHHIERLMVLGNTMLLCGIAPREVYRWFMEMYVDSADWVMLPNVYGMSQYAAGGLFATKPYIAGSNYLRKMSHYPRGEWCDVMDGLYWRFIDRHRSTFAQNHRMGMMLATLDKMDPKRKERLFTAAESWIKKVSFVK